MASSMAWLAPDARGERVAWRRLAGFRCRWYRCLGPWADALLGLADAVLCAGGPVCSLRGCRWIRCWGAGMAACTRRWRRVRSARRRCGICWLRRGRGRGRWCSRSMAPAGRGVMRRPPRAGGITITRRGTARVSAGRGGLVVPAGQPAELRPGLVGLAGGLPPDPPTGRFGAGHRAAGPGPGFPAGAHRGGAAVRLRRLRPDRPGR